MKKFLATVMTAVALAAATMSTAGNVVTESYPIKSDYTTISVSNMIEVELIDAPKNTIRIETDERLMPYLQIVVKDGILVLTFDNQREVERLRKRNRDMEDTHVYVSMRGVDTFVASGMAEFEADMILRGNVLTISASGMAKFNIERVECKKFKVLISGMGEVDTEVNATECIFDISGMSDVDIEGRTDHLSLDLSGMSEVSFEELMARTAKVSISGMSSATIAASESVTGSVSGMSKLKSFGDAQNITVSTSGGSSHKHIRK